MTRYLVLGTLGSLVLDKQSSKKCVNTTYTLAGLTVETTLSIHISSCLRLSSFSSHSAIFSCKILLFPIFSLFKICLFSSFLRRNSDSQKSDFSHFRIAQQTGKKISLPNRLTVEHWSSFRSVQLRQNLEPDA